MGAHVLNRAREPWYIPGSIVAVAGLFRRWQVIDIWPEAGCTKHRLRNTRDHEDEIVVNGIRLEPLGYRPLRGGEA